MFADEIKLDEIIPVEFNRSYLIEDRDNHITKIVNCLCYLKSYDFKTIPIDDIKEIANYILCIVNKPITLRELSNMLTVKLRQDFATESAETSKIY